VSPRAVRYDASVSELGDLFRLQSGYCAQLGSRFYAELLARAADDADAGGPVARVLVGYPHQPVASAVVLRLAGAVHCLVLAGEEPALARRYPSAGGDGNASAAWPELRAVVVRREDELRRVIRERGVQTNEVARTAALVCGFLLVARETGLPLRCLEVGTSAGLNLRWDRFRYDATGASWGDPGSPLVLRDCWLPGPLPFDATAPVVERAGCDPSPIDPTTAEGRLMLRSFTWPDQRERLTLLDAACDIAARVPATVERAGAPEWTAARLATPVAGVATVLFHSIVIQYLDEPSRDRFLGALADAGRRATREAPFAWLRMEPGGEQAEVRLTRWPPGDERLIATAGFHGRDVRYVAAPSSQP
jgi:hypothetical protein